MYIAADKQPLSFSDQVVRLQLKGLTIANTLYAEDFLRKVNYYRIRGYYIHLHDRIADTFISGTTFEDIVNLYCFDNELRDITGQQLLKIEVTMRTKTAYVLAHTYGGLGYTCVNNFHDRKNFYDFYTTAMNEVKRSSDLHIEHFENQYEGRIPIWSIIEIISMSCLSKLLSNLHNAELDQINAEYGFPLTKMLTANFYAITMIRNLCAHGNRIFNRLITIKPSLLVGDLVNLPTGHCNTYYAILFAMKYLSLDVPAWNNFLDSLESLISRYAANVELRHLGLSPNWKAPLIKQ